MRAVTDWEVEKTGRGVALIRCFPKTGRTHQIRVHLSEMGYPILGDYQYCRRFRTAYKPERLLLHAAEVSFPHPTMQRQCKISSPFPNDFAKAVLELFS